MPDAAGDTSDWSRTARRLYGILLEGLHLRAELFSLELAEEQRRLVRMVVASLALVFAVFILLLCVNATLLILLWDTHRGAVLGTSIGFYAAILLAAVLFLRRLRSSHVEPFAATRQVLDQDRQAWLDPR